MKPESKVFAIILGYCAILWATNWSLSHEYSREVGLTASSLDMRGLGALIGLVASIILGRRIWRVSRDLFDMRVRIPMTIRLWGSWSYLWLLMPLAFGTTTHSSGSAEDGAAIKTVFEYGGSWSSPVLSGMAIMLFQLLIRLEAFNPENRQAEKADPSNGGQRSSWNSGFLPRRFWGRFPHWNIQLDSPESWGGSSRCGRRGFRRLWQANGRSRLEFSPHHHK